MRGLNIRCAQRHPLDRAVGLTEGVDLYRSARTASVRTFRQIVRLLTFTAPLVLTGEALALDHLDLIGKWKGSDNKIHRLKAYSFNHILLCRPVANVRGNIRAYRGKFAKGGFELTSKPQTIGDLNNKLPAVLRRELLRKGASYGAKIKIANKGRNLIVQFIGGTVTWTKSDPTKIDSIKKKLGDKVTLTHMITAKTIVEIARRKAVRGIARLEYQNRGHADDAYRAIYKDLVSISELRWLPYSERRTFKRHAKAILGIVSLPAPESQLFNLERHYRWARDYDSGPRIPKPSGRNQHTRAFIWETMPSVQGQMDWLRGLLRAEAKLINLREALPDSTAASTGLRDLISISKFFRAAHSKQWITVDNYAAFVRLYSRLKPELAAIAKSKTVAKPKIKTGPSPLTAPKC